MRSRLTALIITALVLAVAVPALAVTKNGITPTAPKKGARVEAGSRPVFKGRVSGAGTVWVHVSKSNRKNNKGLIKRDAMIQQAKRKGGGFRTRAKFFDFPAFWLNSPGTYYWQAHRINCGEDGNDCYQEGPVVKFRVVA